MANTPESLREEALQHKAAAAESQRRCGSDGFVTQRASRLLAQEAAAKAELLENGGMATFRGLFLADGGARIRAKLIDGKYGLCWAVCDEQGRYTGVFFPAEKAGRRSRKLKSNGLEERDELAPARAEVAGSGYGVSAMMSCSVIEVRTDAGYPENAVSWEG